MPREGAAGSWGTTGVKSNQGAWKNKLFLGDNLRILREVIPAESVDLIYLDPPFNSKTTYDILVKQDEREGSAALQATVFADSWEWDENSESAYEEIIRAHALPLPGLVDALLASYGRSPLMAYVVMMAARLVHLHRVLKPTGSLYLHCDPTAGHYLKLILDSVFGADSFRNEIVWKRSQTRSSISRVFRRAHDVILFYSRTGEYVFNLQYKALSEGSVKQYSRRDRRGRYQLVPLLVSGQRNGDTGRPWRGIDPNLQGKNGMHWVTTPERLEEYEKDGRIHWPAKNGGTPRLKYYIDETKGVPVSDFWDDIPHISSSSTESVGYPTQKPEALLHRIIRTGSNEEQTVLDPFCGSGTTLAVAERLNRKWIGIDASEVAIGIVRRRLAELVATPFEVIGLAEEGEAR